MKRKCGTCKFFEDRGVANSGTCQHIQRRELRDVVLVRQSELACRNSWDQDLWEPASEDVLADGDNSVPFSADDTIAAQDRRARWDNDEIFRGVEDVPILSPYGEQVDRVTDVQVPVTPRAQSSAPVGRFRQQQVEPEDDGWMARPSVYDVRKRREEERRREIQTRQETELKAIGQQMESPDAIGSPADTSAVWSAGDASRAFGRPADRRNRANEDAHVTDSLRDDIGAPRLRLEGSVNVAPPGGDRSPVSQGTEPLPTGEVKAALDQGMGHVTQSGPVVYVDGGTGRDQLSARPQERHERLPDADTNDPLDRDERVRGLQRCCGTCRDFRQVGDGTRGQCVNPYAFGERRMVQSDQLACRSSLGMWWMPTDEIWLERADTSHHGRPTPLLDAAARGEQVSYGGRESRRR